MTAVSAERPGTHRRPILGLDRLVGAMPWPKSYLRRLLVICATGVVAPSAVLFAVTFAFWPDLLADWPAFAVATLVANLLGAALAVVCIRSALAPLTQSVAALRAYTRYGRVPDMRDSDIGDVGTLMREMRQIILAAESTHAELLRRAETDPLTEVANRRNFLRRGEEGMRKARRRGVPLSIVVFDIDHFKTVNDTFGHAAGDAVLRMVVGVVERRLRDGDGLARLGGEEFAILLVSAPLPEALRIAERLREAVASLPMPALDGSMVTASFGVAVHDMSDQRFEALLSRADRALYDAKNAGRNCVAFRLVSDDAETPSDTGMLPRTVATQAQGERPAPIWLVD